VNIRSQYQGLSFLVNLPKQFVLAGRQRKLFDNMKKVGWLLGDLRNKALAAEFELE